MLETMTQVDTHDHPLPDGIWSRAYRFLTLGFLLTTAAMAFEQLSVATTMPATIRELGGLAWYGWVFSAFMLAMIITLTIGGGEVDRVGPLRPFVGGVVLFALGLVVAGFAPTMPVLIAGRAVQGLGAGLIASVLYAAIGRAYPETTRPRMLALISSAYTLPSLIGPALAGLVADYVGWRWIFLALAPVVPLAALLVLPALRRFTQVAATPRDWGRIGAAARLAAGVGLLMSGLGSTQTLLLTLGLIALGAALAIPALRRLLPAGSHTVGLSAALFSAILLNMGFFGVDAFVPLALTTVRSQSASFAGLALTAATISWIASAWLQAHLAARQSRRLLVTVGLVLIVAGIGSVLSVLQPQVPVWLALLAWGMAGLGMGQASPTLTLLSMELAPSGQEGASTSAMGLAGILGIALGTGLGGVIIGNTEAGSSVSAANVAGHGLLMIAGLVLALWFAWRLPGRSQAQAGLQAVMSHS